MKGITHFLTGIALATLFPEVTNAGVNGSLLPVVGGVGALLPDTLDFKFVQYWEQYDIELDPGLQPNAEQLVETIADVIQSTYTSGRSVHLRAHTLQLGVDAWLRYTFEFSPSENLITVHVGPRVTTDQKITGGTHEILQTATRHLKVPMHIPYQRTYDIDIFQGPSFLFSRQDDAVNIQFLDWHHRWTHSLLIAPIVGFVIACLVALVFNDAKAGQWAWILCTIGYCAHVLQDQMGRMGCNLWWPLTKKRKSGLSLFRSGDFLPNSLTVILSLLLILYNLDRYGQASYLSGSLYWGIIAGCTVFILIVSYLLQHRITATDANQNP